jgi:hypothetical protein
MVVRCPGGDAEIGNVGSGPAINVRYRAVHNIADATEQVRVDTWLVFFPERNS